MDVVAINDAPVFFSLLRRPLPSVTLQDAGDPDSSLEESASDFEPSASDESDDDRSCTFDQNEPGSPDLLAPPRQAKRRAAQRPVRFVDDSPRPLAAGSASAMHGGVRRSSSIGPATAPSSRDGAAPSAVRRPVQVSGHAAVSLPGFSTSPSGGGSTSAVRDSRRPQAAGSLPGFARPRQVPGGSTGVSSATTSSEARGTHGVGRQGAPAARNGLSGSSSGGVTGASGFGRIGKVSSQQRGSSNRNHSQATINGSMTAVEIYRSFTVAGIARVQLASLLGILMAELGVAGATAVSLEYLLFFGFLATVVRSGFVFSAVGEICKHLFRQQFR